MHHEVVDAELADPVTRRLTLTSSRRVRSERIERVTDIDFTLTREKKITPGPPFSTASTNAARLPPRHLMKDGTEISDPRHDLPGYGPCSEASRSANAITPHIRFGAYDRLRTTPEHQSIYPDAKAHHLIVAWGRLGVLREHRAVWCLAKLKPDGTVTRWPK